MRLSAIVTAFAVSAVLVVAGPTPAQATASASVTPGHVASAAGSRALPRRAMNDEVFRNNKGWLIFKGDVEPGLERPERPDLQAPLQEGLRVDSRQEDPHRRLRPLAHPHLCPPHRLLVLEGHRPQGRGVRHFRHPDLAHLRRVVEKPRHSTRWTRAEAKRRRKKAPWRDPPTLSSPVRHVETRDQAERWTTLHANCSGGIASCPRPKGPWTSLRQVRRRCSLWAGMRGSARPLW